MEALPSMKQYLEDRTSDSFALDLSWLMYLQDIFRKYLKYLEILFGDEMMNFLMNLSNHMADCKERPRLVGIGTDPGLVDKVGFGLPMDQDNHIWGFS